MKKNISNLIGFGIIMMIISCKTYTIPTESFKEQMKNTNSSNMKDVTINNPLTFGNISYSANNINRIIVEDKDEDNFIRNYENVLPISTEWIDKSQTQKWDWSNLVYQ